MGKDLKNFIISFSSFYKAAYAKDVLRGKGINSTLGKLPTSLAKSCSSGLYFQGENKDEVLKILQNNNIANKGVFEIDDNRV